MEEIEATMTHFAIVPSQYGTLADIEAAIAALERLCEDFTSCLAFLEKQL
jgi:hypothetical protein